MPLRQHGNQLRQILGDLLAKRDLTRHAFCKLIKLGPSTLSMLERRSPTSLPKQLNLDAWAKALNLTDPERRKLKLAAELSWSPAGVQDLVAKLLKENEELRRR